MAVVVYTLICLKNRSQHIVRAIPTALTGFPNLTGFLNEFESLIVN